jgi:hypothetical protein
MRSTTMVWILVLGFTGAVTSRAAAQDQAAQAVTAQAQSALAAPVTPAVPAHLDPTARVERPGVGPRLPEFVASIPLPVEQPAPAPPSNIVIPVTS